MSKRTTTRAPRVALHLRTREDFTQAIDTTGHLQLELAQLEADRDAAVAALKATHAEKIEALKAQITLHLEAAAAYGTRFATEVFPAGHRTGETELCTYGIRTDPPSVKVASRTTEEAVIAALKEHTLTDCIRTREELNKEVIAQKFPTPAQFILTQCGLRLTQADRFFVKSKEPSATRTATPAAI